MPVKALMMILAMVAFMSAAIAIEENEPDAELLEFLADWDSGDGQWVEPFSFEQTNTEAMGRDDGHVQARQEKKDEH